MKSAALFSAFLSAAALAFATAGFAQPLLQIRIDTGLLAGSVDDGVESWKGIPFAAAPVGALRWRAPQPVAPWSGVRTAIAYGNDCMQVPFPSDAAPLGTPPAEDCLYANVWRPAGARGKLPVIVWIYGGGFVNGGASPPTYAGANLARQGVLFVSFNYRVGRFGTFAHPALTRANEDNGLLGNYGFMDQIAALRWVRRNVAAFGGDPANVTVVGESAGGMSVHMLVTSPMAHGLFARAVMMSGGNGGSMSANDLAAVEKIGAEFGASKGVAPDAPDALERLRALSAETVTDGLNMMALFRPDGRETFARPFVDGKIAVDANAAYASGSFAHVPMMIGATSADMGGRTGIMIAGGRSVAGRIAENGVPVYAYRFAYVADAAAKDSGMPGAARGAQHATDIPYFFDTTAIKYGEATTARDVAVGKAMSTYLTNFAKYGDPNGAGLTHWPRYERARDEIMIFAEDGKPVAQRDPWGAEIDAAAAASAQHSPASEVTQSPLRQPHGRQ